VFGEEILAGNELFGMDRRNPVRHTSAAVTLRARGRRAFIGFPRVVERFFALERDPLRWRSGITLVKTLS
jgi:hypothetical protein